MPAKNDKDKANSEKSIKGKKPIAHKKILILLAAILVIIIALFLIIGSCSRNKNDEEEETTTTTSTEVETTTTIIETTTTETEEPDQDIVPEELQNYLTGLAMENESLTNQRPIAIMINNIKVATPHIGVGKADMVFEMEVEGGLTRMMAFFASVDTIPEIGSIRSARHNFVDLAGAFDAVPVHVGASYMGNNQMAAQNTEHLDAGVLPDNFWRDDAWRRDRGYEHSVRTTGELLKDAMEQKGLRTEIDPDYNKPFNFKDNLEIEAVGDISAKKADIPLTHSSRISVLYNEDKQAYEKNQHGTIQADFVDGVPYTYTNVLILNTTVRAAEGSGGKLREIGMSGGSGYYLSAGTATEINWEKGGTYDQFEFTDENGNEINFNRGTFYIAMISEKGKVSFSDSID